MQLRERVREFESSLKESSLALKLGFVELAQV